MSSVLHSPLAHEAQADSNVTSAHAPLTDPLGMFGIADVNVYCRIPQEGLEFVGSGMQWRYEGRGPDRFAQAQRAAAEFFQSRASKELPPPLRRLWGGFSFYNDEPAERHAQGGGSSTIPSCLWYAPRTQYLRLHDRAYFSGDPGLLEALQAAPCPAGSVDGWRVESEDPAEWIDNVKTALDALRSGGVSKLVVAREQRLSSENPLSVADLLDVLRTSHPGALFAFRFPSSGDWFVSATPEPLVSVTRGQARTQAIAGTIARGESEKQAEAFARELLTSSKDRTEHDWVVKSIREAVSPYSEMLAASDPIVMRLGKLQHMVTPIRMRLRPGTRPLDLVAALHPTAAVGGYPRATAVDWLRRNEGITRGWYAGPIGWMDGGGNASFWVGIRSGMFSPGGARLYAGAGIVPASEPVKEWAETALKLSLFHQVLGIR